MIDTIQNLDFSKLTVADRLKLIGTIWDSIVTEGLPESIPESHKQILDQRLEEHQNAPDDVIPWDEVRKESE